MLILCHFQILLAISEVQLTLHKVHTVHTVKSALSLKWQVGFENDMKMAPIFTIIFVSKILIWQCITLLEHTFLVDGLNSLKVIYYGMYLNFEADKRSLNEWNVLFSLLLYNDLDLNNQKILWLQSIYWFERKLGFWTTLQPT